MRAEPGHWIVVRGRTLDAPSREGRIEEVPHADGSPPYLVHWLDDDRRSLVYPGPDAVVLAGRPHGGSGTRP